MPKLFAIKLLSQPELVKLARKARDLTRRKGVLMDLVYPVN